jgi:hypothetical protein
MSTEFSSAGADSRISRSANGADTPPAECVEVSEDGREVVGVCPDEVALLLDGNPGLPYGGTPDWSNTLRRQVGALQIADMNGDGLNDLVVGCFNSSSFPPYDDWRNFIHYNTGTSLELNPSWFSTDQVSTGDLQVGLINNDPYPDIFCANGGPSMSPSVIYWGTAAGPVSAPGWTSQIAGNSWTNYAMLFDADHDGDTDVFTANQGNSQNDPFRPMFMFRNVAGQLETTPSWQSAEISIQNFLAFADYDRDGWEDLAVSKWANFESGIYENINGALQTTPVWTTGATTTDKGIGWADFDGNNWPDLALGKDPTQLWTNTNGTLAQTWSSKTPFFSHQDLRIEDVDRDGDPDLAEVHFGDGRTHLYLNTNGTLASVPSWTYDAPVVGNAIAFGDINGDCMPDLAIGYSGEPSVVIFHNKLPRCLGDADHNGNVNIDDLLGVINAWGSGSSAHDFAPGCGNGTVDIDDLLAVINAWGECP